MKSWSKIQRKMNQISKENRMKPNGFFQELWLKFFLMKFLSHFIIKKSKF